MWSRVDERSECSATDKISILQKLFILLFIKVEFAEAEAMCEYIPEILFVMETSAKENTNIEDAFVCLATELKRRYDSLNLDVDNAITLGQGKPLNSCSSGGNCSLT